MEDRGMMTNTVRDDPARQRYELQVEGALAFINYRRNGHIVSMTYPEVPAALRGGGVGSRLVEGALGLVRERGEKVVPLCSFVASHIRRHPEHHDLLADGGR